MLFLIEVISHCGTERHNMSSIAGLNHRLAADFLKPLGREVFKEKVLNDIIKKIKSVFFSCKYQRKCCYSTAAL